MSHAMMSPEELEQRLFSVNKVQPCKRPDGTWDRSRWLVVYDYDFEFYRGKSVTGQTLREALEAIK